jgi:hypothetical protein
MKILIIVMVFLTGFLLIPSDVFALRCDGKLVHIGDRKIEVFQKCGTPSLIEKWKIENTTFIERSAGKYSKDILTSQEDRQEIKTEHVEEWTYNFGTNRFIQFLTFTNDRLTNIEVGSRGFEGDFPTDFDKTRCGKRVEEEDRKIDVIMKCGQPVFEETRIEERSTSETDSKQIGDEPGQVDENKGDNIGDQKIIINKSTRYQEHRVFVNITEWSFNFGPNYFLQFITFENGKVIKSEHGDYGYK